MMWPALLVAFIVVVTSFAYFLAQLWRWVEREIELERHHREAVEARREDAIRRMIESVKR